MNSAGGGMHAVMEVASTFSYFGLSANLITYMTGPLGHSNAAAAASVNVWSGTASIMPLFGAFVADTWLGRYRSIILGGIFYVLVIKIFLSYAALYNLLLRNKGCG
jgi:peptide/histidine transporter 3/4